MIGTITGKDVVLHSITIIQSWGPRAYLRCLRAALARRPTTFLSALYAGRR